MLRVSNPLAFRGLGCRLTTVAVALLPLMILPGCSKGGRLPASGKVTLNGAGVPHLFIKFEPPKGGESAFAETDPNGHFVLQGAGNERGVRPGTYRVWLEYRIGDPEPNAPMPKGGFGPSPALKSALEHYSREKSTLTIDISEARDDIAITL